MGFISKKVIYKLKIIQPTVRKIVNILKYLDPEGGAVSDLQGSQLKLACVEKRAPLRLPCISAFLKLRLVIGNYTVYWYRTLVGMGRL